jgi:hypothetical protein
MADQQDSSWMFGNKGGQDVGAGLGGGIGALIGYFLSQGDRDKARQLIDEATGQFQGLDPRIQAQEAQAVQAGPSAFNKVNVDPTTRAEQLEAVNQLRGIYSQGGMDPQARADTAQAMQTANQNAAALQGNIRNQMAQRGLSSSGANFAAQRSAAQNAANQGGLMALQAQAAGSQRAMGALQGAAGLAGQVRTQDYGQAADKAKATDLINQFNANLSTNNNQFNAGQRQNAQQSTFNNGYAKAQGVGGQAKAYQGLAGDTQRVAYGVGSGLGSWLGNNAEAGMKIMGGGF